MNKVEVALVFGLCCLMTQTCALNGSGPPPLHINRISIDTVSLTQGSRVTIGVVSYWPRCAFTRVTARILEGDGFRIVSQPALAVDSIHKGDTATFVATIQPIAKGTWKVRVQAHANYGQDTLTIWANDCLYIHLSDTLNRVMTATEYILLQSPVGKTMRIPKPDKVIYTPPGKTAKPRYPSTKQDSTSTIPKADKVIDTTRSKKARPAPTDSSTRKDSTSGKRSGTFNVIGSLYYHDPRDPQGWTRAAINVTVEVWNDNEYDDPPSADVLLGTGITDWYGCYSFWGLDNSDGDGTADPYIIWRSDNASWEVKRPNSGPIYKWYSQIIRDVGDDSTADFGDHTVVSYPEAMWCFQYINLGWVKAEMVGPHPDPVSCIWPGDRSYSYDSAGIMFMYHDDADAIDAVNHEYAHSLMFQAYGGSFPVACDPVVQWINLAYCQTFGWTEGWAYFFPLVVTDDHIYTYHPAGPYYNLETPPTGADSADWGPGCPARVAGALLDLWDTNNDGQDENLDYPITFETMYTWGLHWQRDSTFREYWDHVRDGELSYPQSYRGTRSIANNTIYDFPGRMRGDCNADNMIDVADEVYIINYVFVPGFPPPVPYLLVGDANCDGSVDIGDVVYIVQWSFVPGSPAPCPFV